MSKQTTTISRREFLTQITALATALGSFPVSALQQLRIASPVNETQTWLGEEPWITIAAVQDHLFPAGDKIPGAGDIRALYYLHSTIENPAADAEDRQFIMDGAGWLNGLGKERYQSVFIELDESQREDLLREIERSRAGRNWLSLLLTYLMEALLSAPVYGGNPGGIGWQWLQHQPGYPEPPADKAWYRLAAPVRLHRKA